MIKPIDLSVIVPSFNEEDVIADTLKQLAAYVHDHPELGVCEVVVVAAGSDKTAEIAGTFKSKFDALQVITPEKPAGKGRDVRLGFQAARGALQLFTDADLSTPLHHIGRMVELLQTGNDIVIGRRDLRKIHGGRLRSMLSVASNLLVRTLLLPDIRDSQCGFKGFRAEAARSLFTEDLQINGWGFDIELLVAARRAKYRIAQMPIADWHEARADDLRNEKLGGAAMRTLRDVLGIRFELWSASLARHLYVIAALAGVASFSIALWIGSQQSVWFDEAYSINLIPHSIGRIIQLTGVDVHPPLYYLLLKAWAAIFGTGDIALRSFSALCCGLTVAVGILLVKRLWDARAALVAAPFAVAAPLLLRYGFEIRMYALAGLIGVLATYVLVAAWQSTNAAQRRLLWVTYALLVATGLYTLYYTGLVWAVHLVWCIYMARTGRQKLAWPKLLKQPWFISYVAAVVLFLAWVPSFLHQLSNVQSGFWIGPARYTNVVSIWSISLNYLAEWQLTPWRSVGFMAAFVAAIYFIVVAFQVSLRTQRRNLTLLTLYAVLPVILLYCVSLPPLQSVFIERYISQTILGAYLLLGVSIAVVLRRRRSVLLRVAALGLLVVLIQGVFTLNNVGNYNFERLDKPNARAASAYLQRNVTTNDPIVTDGPFTYMSFHHYLPHNNVRFYSSGPVSKTGGYAMLHGSPLRVSSIHSFAGRPVWIVYAGKSADYIPANHVRTRGREIGEYGIYLYTPVVPPCHNRCRQAHSAKLSHPLNLSLKTHRRSSRT